MEVRRSVVLSAAEKIIKMNKFVTLVVHDRIRLRIELGLEETMAHVTRNSLDVIVMVAETQMHGHLEAVGDDLGIIQAGRALEIKLVVGGGIVMEVVTDQKYLFDGGMKRIDKIARRDETRSSEQDALVVLHSILTALDIEVVDDMGISHKSEIELVRRSRGPRLLSPESPGEQAAERCAGERGKLSAV